MKINSIESRPKSKFRPLPMDTVSLEKLASRKLRMTAKEALAHAEKLYTEGEFLAMIHIFPLECIRKTGYPLSLIFSCVLA